ncbi:MAG: alkaline phosphatase D family protein [Akkermansiaceae bacterium]|nr:alkaline phosphatase D family protein [Akkermansiaceae bacterium]
MRGMLPSGLIPGFLALTGIFSPLGAQTGPMVGTVTPTEAHFLYRPGDVETALRLTVLDGAAEVASADATSAAASDYVAKFHVTGLQADRDYDYRIDAINGGTPTPVLGPADGLSFRTPLPVGKRGVVTAGFVSCANATSEPVWQRMETLGVDYLLLGGDTPYIDTGNLTQIRDKHQAFLSTPFMASLIRKTPTVGTWDDHDFGLNNGNGASVSYKNLTRQGFMEYRAHGRFGEGDGGVHHQLATGPMEIFLLDPRWYSQTLESPVDPTQKTCFGPAQWQWIRDALRASKAPFKVLLMGQIWQDKKNSETDDMFTYWYERDALLDYVREQGIPGVVLVGGDIHVSRHLIHPRRVGYDLHDFITSPAHTSVIPSLDVAHPDLEWSSQQPRQFLTLTADTRVTPAILSARFYLADGSIQREVVVPYDQLIPRSGEGLGKGLRAWWDFSGDFENRSVLAGRAHAVAENGASLVADGGLRGGAASFVRASSQYLRVPRSVLDDNSAAHTLSLWCKATGLPAHGSTDRQFLVESTLNGAVGNDPAYHFSLGLRASATDPEKVNLQLHTFTLQPAASTSSAPTAIAQGPFDFEVDRSVLADLWTHLVVGFDRTHLKLHINGTEAVSHALPVPGPASEMGGLVIGGHREGTGRNFQGLIDEVAIWQRTLTPAEITELHGSGTPPALPLALLEEDRDGDTLADWYENLHGLDPDAPADALSDVDGDGVPAYLEFQAGSHPGLDDTPLYDTLRNLANPGASQPIVAFRDPATGNLTVNLTLEASEYLGAWIPADATPIDDLPGSDLRFELPGHESPRMFFRGRLMGP